MSLFDTVKDDDIIQELRDVDISHMTPMDALNKLYELQNKVKNNLARKGKKVPEAAGCGASCASCGNAAACGGHAIATATETVAGKDE